MSQKTNFELSQEGKEFVIKELQRYETPFSALIPCLFRAQKENQGVITDEVIEHLSTLMKIPTIKIHEVFHFYTMFNKNPVGRYHVQVCCNISCWMAGADQLTKSLCQSLDVSEGEVSQQRRYTISRVECLGACDRAPMLQVTDTHQGPASTKEFGPVNAEQALKELEALR